MTCRLGNVYAWIYQQPWEFSALSFIHAHTKR
jgi:hypothetical protein